MRPPTLKTHQDVVLIPGMAGLLGNLLGFLFMDICEIDISHLSIHISYLLGSSRRLPMFVQEKESEMFC